MFYGYFGVFILSFVSNAVPFMTIPYLAVIFTASISSDLAILIATSSLGATLGKMISYFVGRGARKVITRSERYRKKFDLLRRLLGDYTFLAIVIVTATALPDDYVFIPAGIMRYSVFKTFVATLIGKSVITALVAISGRFGGVMLGGLIKNVLGEEITSPWIALILFLVFLLIFVVYMKLDVESLLEEKILKGKVKDP